MVLISRSHRLSFKYLFGILVLSASTGSLQAQAQSIPSTAQAERVAPIAQETYKIEPAPVTNIDNVKDGIRYSQPPQNADKITFKLSSISIQGANVYSSDELQALFKDDIGKLISLDRVWRMSDEITTKYRKDGYFLSRAFIPAQEIGKGNIIIKIVEGYIKDIQLESTLQGLKVIQDLNTELTSQKPVSSKDLERYHLLLTDFSGLQNLQGTLTPITDNRDGGVTLVYKRGNAPTHNGFAGINNFGSQYLGPMQSLVYWQGSLIPTQNSFIAVRSSLPVDEMKAVNASHTIPLTPDTNITFSAGYTKANPGFTLAPQEIESKSIDLGFTINHKIIRQRLENWSVSVGLDGRNSTSTLLNTTTLSHDKVRAARLSTTYDTYNSTGAFNKGTVTVSRGLDFLGSSREDDINISRDGAEPDFSKIEVEYSRYQFLPHSIIASATIKGQKASGSLYSSEEFGFGGTDMGRAYNSSEITGDDGIAASLELNYSGLPELGYFQLSPYAFYDIGKVWNKNSGQVDSASASSVGIGTRFSHISGLSGMIQVAVPLTKDVDTPLYGADDDAARIAAQIGYQF